MGPKLNLEFLTSEECEKIIGVIEKDLVLQHTEQQRIWNISEEVRDINEFCKILAKQNLFNESYCLHCFLKFRIIFRKKIVCTLCGFNFCSGCVVFDSESGGNACHFCERKRQCQKQSLEWFYLRVRAKFKRSGSSKVIRCFASHSSPSASKSHSLDGHSGSPLHFGCDLLGDCVHCDRLSEGNDDECKKPEGRELFQSTEKVDDDMDKLTERLMNMQSSCVEENDLMKKHVNEIITMDRSLMDIDETLKSLDNSLSKDHHHHHHHHGCYYNHHHHPPTSHDDCFGCFHHCSNETLLNLAANQISDITTVAAGILEKTMNKAMGAIGKDGEDKGDGSGTSCRGNRSTTSGVNSAEAFCKSEDSGCCDELKIDQSDSDESCKEQRLKSVEKEVYKIASKTYVLGDRLTDLEDEVTVSNKDVFLRKVNFYEDEVAELAVEVNSNQREVELLQKKLVETLW